MVVEVYKVKSDLSYYGILPGDEKTYVKFDLGTGQSVKGLWQKNISFYIRDLIKCKRGDFLYLNPTTISFYEKSLGVIICNILEASGECLESILDDTDEKLITFNPLVIYDCLDLENTVFETYNFRGKISNIAVDIHSFNLDKIGDSSIFKLPGRYVHPTYVVTGLHDEEKDFYVQYKKLGLTGLDFELVWSNE